MWGGPHRSGAAGGAPVAYRGQQRTRGFLQTSLRRTARSAVAVGCEGGEAIARGVRAPARAALSYRRGPGGTPRHTACAHTTGDGRATSMRAARAMPLTENFVHT